MNEIRYFSMFTGVGGFELGLERTNDNKSKIEGIYPKEDSSCNTSEPLQTTTFNCVGVSEIDKYSSELLKKKFPKVKNYGDATKIDPRELPDFDMLCGGFPCQAFSIAGSRRGFDDTRGTMFFEVARILEVKRPQIVFLENVKGLLNHNKGQTFTVILETLDELGYETEWMVLNSKFFGVPQNRERVFIIGNLRGTRRPEILPFKRNNVQVTHKEHKNQEGILLSAKDGARGTNESNFLDTMYHKGLGSKQSRIAVAVLTPDREDKRQNGRRIKDIGEPMFTITGQDLHGIAQVNNPTHSNDRVYSPKGISPTINTAQGGNRQPFIITHKQSDNSNKEANTDGM